MEKVKISFLTQYNKIVNAYMQNKLNPTECTACFVGNLLNGNADWGLGRNVHTGEVDFSHPLLKDATEFKRRALACLMQESGNFYTMKEIAKIEKVFLTELQEGNTGYEAHKCIGGSRYEERLFKAMEVTLEHLKALHQSKGEIIEDNPIFSKRELVEA